METPEPIAENEEQKIAVEDQPKVSDEYIANEISPISEKDAILFLDVNLGKGESARIVVYEGDKAE